MCNYRGLTCLAPNVISIPPCNVNAQLIRDIKRIKVIMTQDRLYGCSNTGMQKEYYKMKIKTLAIRTTKKKV